MGGLDYIFGLPQSNATLTVLGLTALTHLPDLLVLIFLFLFEWLNGIHGHFKTVIGVWSIYM